MEEQSVFDSIRGKSDRFRPGTAWGVNEAGKWVTASGDSMTATAANPVLHASSAQIGPLVCPSFAGDETSATDFYVTNLLQSPPAGVRIEPAAGNYVTILGTHVDPQSVNNGGGIQENGAITTGKPNRGRGTTIATLSDGTSKTIVVTETKEEGFNCWYDGASAWVLGFLPETMSQFTLNASTDTNGDGVPDFNIVGSSVANVRSALQFGPAAPEQEGNPLFHYWPQYFSAESRIWGPSSEHGGGVIVVGFADGHTSTLPTNTDKGAWYAGITAGGREAIGFTDN